MKTQQNGKWCFTEQKKANVIKQFILQIRENTCNLAEKWTEGGIKWFRRKIPNNKHHKRSIQFHPQLKKHKLKQ